MMRKQGQMGPGLDVAKPRITSAANRDDAESVHERRHPGRGSEDPVYEVIRHNVEEDDPEVGKNHRFEITDFIIRTKIRSDPKQNRESKEETEKLDDRVREIRQIRCSAKKHKGLFGCVL